MKSTHTITITGERLMAMYDNDMSVYGTPGAHETYWSSRPNFQFDQCLATAQEIIEAACMEHGLDEEELRTFEEEIEYEIELLPARQD